MMALINTTTQENRESVLFQPVLIAYPTSFLDNHSSYIIGKYGEAMEAVHQTDGQNTTTIKLFPTEAFSSNSPVLNTRSRTQQFK